MKNYIKNSNGNYLCYLEENLPTLDSFCGDTLLHIVQKWELQQALIEDRNAEHWLYEHILEKAAVRTVNNTGFKVIIF